MADSTWTSDASIVDAGALDRLTRVIDDESPLVVEHRFYREARAPFRFVCDDPDELKHYVETEARPGDSFYFWKFEDCCRDDNVLYSGKRPDAEGRVPVGGAY